ncbi:MAG TPA: pyruvate formate-lyase-activating protein [Vicinamibacterales bacterium]|nr:pyruvate formate-lyase-activating protein [Vicinamibacterales bacterium]
MRDGEPAVWTPSLEARNPFTLRVNLGTDVPETTVREALATGDMGFLHSFTTGATVDGPGVRVVAWTTGCNFRCRYCHNPDTWTMSNGMPISIARATEELRKYQHGVKAMRGGFTLSGGEPLMQHRFTLKLLRAAQALGIHTALDTNGFYGDRLSDEDLEVADLVLLDIKQWDPERHKDLTGVDNAPTLAFARRLAARHRPVWLRYVLVPGHTDNLDGIQHLARFTAGLGNVQRVDVLPFHQLGTFKWAKLGIPYTLSDVSPPDASLVDRVCGLFRAEGLKAH